ncbi:DUF917 domain-containing protein [Streptomyces avermitilis]|uniref:DUF917 domain-containing protein n=1 Tax=Streptomyces avermitilis TaxID=33903 RepID=UPI0033AF36FC
MRELNVADIVDLARGAAILGSGGGGNPYMGELIAERAIADNGPVAVVDVAEVPADAIVAPVAVMGAPTVFQERLLAGDEIRRAIAAAGAAVGRPPTHLLAAEVGGVNATMPIAPAAELRLPLLDGDLMGRAFPELPMLLPTLAGIRMSPTVLADDKGNVVILDTVSADWSERIARACAVAMGGTAAVVLAVLPAGELSCAVTPGTLLLAQDVGRMVRMARENHADPVEAARRALGGVNVFLGKVVDVDRRLTGGFIRGQAVVEGIGTKWGETLVLTFQNEYLLATRGGEPVVTTPNLICVLEEETGEPVPADVMNYGLRIAVIGAPCDPRWSSPRGLEMVGPGYFGYDCPYVSLPTEPI